ncbi:EEP domain-containing protein, partial [Pseudomonas aeruginosa]
RNLDHILLSSDLALEWVDVLDQPISDHLPVSVEFRLPDNLRDKALVVGGDAGSPP